MRSSSRPKGRTSSTWAESRRARGPSRWPRTRSCRRVVPVLERVAAARTGVQLSIDTSKRDVAGAALDAGATYVNDVTAFRADPGMAGLVAERGRRVLPHAHARRAAHDAGDPRYEDVVSDVKAFLEERLAFAVAEGVPEERVMLDPGIGFGKTLEHNLELLRRLDEIVAARAPDRGRRPRASRSSGGSPAARWASACPAPSPPTSWRWSAGHRSSGSTRSRPSGMPWRWRLLRSGHGARRRARRRNRRDRRRRVGRRRGRGRRDGRHDRDRRVVPLHAPRRQRGGAQGRAAHGDRPASRRRGVRRDAHRPHRGHRGLRGGLPDGRPGVAADLPHAGAAVRGDRRQGAVRVSGGERLGQGGQAGAADSRSRSRRSRSRCWREPS